MSAAAALRLYRQAMTRLDDLDALLRSTQTDIVSTQQSDELSVEEKTRRIREARDALIAQARTDRTEVKRILDEADDEARDALSGDVTDTALEARKARATPRVSRLLDAGKPLKDVAQVFVDSEDLDALRALRDEVPSYVAAVGDLNRDARNDKTKRLTLALDQLMRPLLPAEEQLVVDVRLNVEEAEAFLDSITKFATTVGSSGSKTRFHSYARPVKV